MEATNDKKYWIHKKVWMIVIVVVAFLLVGGGIGAYFGIQYYNNYLAPGWHQHDEGVCYRIEEEKRFATGITEIEGEKYCFGNDTYLLYGWIQYEDQIYYADEEGILQKGAVELDGKTHYFDEETGSLLVGWQENNTRYYLEDGTLAEGYLTVDGIPYKFLEGGIPYVGMEETDQGIRLFTREGLAEGITEYEGTTYYFLNTYMQNGLCQIENNWYYFGEDGSMQHGWIRLEEKDYYFGEDGAKLTGTQTIDGETYYLTEDGELISGWVETENGTYYYSTHGEKLTGTQTIDGETYYLASDGQLLSGWITRNGNKYYYSSHGKLLTGWQTIGKKRYYFQDDGSMAVNTTIGKYRIDSDGVASKIPATVDNLNAYLDEILDDYGRSPSAIHNAVCSMLSYKYSDEGSIEQMACDAINNRRGACWHYSSLGYMLLQRAGYQVYYVRGTYLPKGNPHRWLYVKFSDGWYYMDCMHYDRLKMTDEEYASLKFDWDRSGLPSN